MTMLFPVKEVFKLEADLFYNNRDEITRRLMGIRFNGYLVRRTMSPDTVLVMAYDSVQGTFILDMADESEDKEDFINNNYHVDLISCIETTFDGRRCWQMQFSFAKQISSFFFSLN